MGTYIKYIGAGVVLVYLALNYYIGLRSFQALKAFFPSLHPIVFWPVFALLATAFIIDRFAQFDIPVISQVGMYWLAIFFYLLLFYGILDLIGLFQAKIFPASISLLWQSQKIYVSALALTLLVLVAGTINAYSPVNVKHDIQINKQAGELNTLKTVLISDLHFSASAYTAYMETAAEAITAMEPDLIFLAGDIFEGSIDPATQKKMDRMLDKLKAKHGIYAVFGNHEHYGNQVENITAYLQAKGIILLQDDVTEAMDGSVYIAGRNDRSSGYNMVSARKPLAEMLQGLDPAKPVILLDHQPQDVEEARKAGVDLMLSGHTHGGQLWPAQIVTKRIFVVDRGLWQSGDFHLLVTTGLGVWGPPVRTSSKSEIVEINLNFQ